MEIASEWLDHVFDNASSSAERVKRHAAQLGTACHEGIDAVVRATAGQDEETIIRAGIDVGVRSLGSGRKNSDDDAARAEYESDVAVVERVVRGLNTWLRSSSLDIDPRGDTQVVCHTYQYVDAALSNCTSSHVVVRPDTLVHWMPLRQIATQVRGWSLTSRHRTRSMIRTRSNSRRTWVEFPLARIIVNVGLTSGVHFRGHSYVAAMNEMEGHGPVVAPAEPGAKSGLVTGAMAVRLDKKTGKVAEVRRVASLPVAFDGFKAALLLWRLNHGSKTQQQPLLV